MVYIYMLFIDLNEQLYYVDRYDLQFTCTKTSDIFIIIMIIMKIINANLFCANIQRKTT